MAKLLDLTGRRFGRLTVLSRADEQAGRGIRWLCSCDCGGQATVRGSSLTGGITVSCGCKRREGGAKALDLTGQQFGELTVLGRGERRTKAPRAHWLCQCSCGETTTVSSHNLQQGHVKSCGHLRRRAEG